MMSKYKKEIEEKQGPNLNELDDMINKLGNEDGKDVPLGEGEGEEKNKVRCN